LANIIWGRVFDIQRISRPALAKVTWGIFSVFMLAMMSWQVANEKSYADAVPAITLDWASPGFGRGFASMMLIRFFNESHYMFVYWIVGTFFDDLESLTLSVGLIRSFESVGSCLSFGIGAAKVPPMVNLIVAYVMFCITIPATTWAVFLVPERPEAVKLLEDSSSDNQADTTEGAAAIVR
jgi:hypothetical protein